MGLLENRRRKLQPPMIPLGMMMNSSQEGFPEEVHQQRAWVYQLKSTCLVSRVIGNLSTGTDLATFPLDDF